MSSYLCSTTLGRSAEFKAPLGRLIPINKDRIGISVVRQNTIGRLLVQPARRLLIILFMGNKRHPDEASMTAREQIEKDPDRPPNCRSSGPIQNPILSAEYWTRQRIPHAIGAGHDISDDDCARFGTYH